MAIRLISPIRQIFSLTSPKVNFLVIHNHNFNYLLFNFLNIKLELNYREKYNDVSFNN